MKQFDILSLNYKPKQVRELIEHKPSEPCLIGIDISYVVCVNLSDDLKNKIMTKNFTVSVAGFCSYQAAIYDKYQTSLFFAQRYCLNKIVDKCSIKLDFEDGTQDSFRLEIRNKDAYDLDFGELKNHGITKKWVLENDKFEERQLSLFCNIL